MSRPIVLDKVSENNFSEKLQHSSTYCIFAPNKFGKVSNLAQIRSN